MQSVTNDNWGLISDNWSTKFYAVIWLVTTTRVLNYYRTMHLCRFTTKICTTQNLRRSTAHILRRGLFLVRLVFAN